jgi:hypothetical protein
VHPSGSNVGRHWSHEQRSGGEQQLRVRLACLGCSCKQKCFSTMTTDPTSHVQLVGAMLLLDTVMAASGQVTAYVPTHSHNRQLHLLR